LEATRKELAAEKERLEKEGKKAQRRSKSIPSVLDSKINLNNEKIRLNQKEITDTEIAIVSKNDEIKNITQDNMTFLQKNKITGSNEGQIQKKILNKIEKSK